MALERKWQAVNATPLTADGTQLGLITLADTAGLRTKQAVYLKSNTKPMTAFQVQEVLSPTEVILGAPGARVGRENFVDLSAWTVADAAILGAPEQNKQANPPDKDHYSAIYESDPVVADRVIFVDQYGRFYGEGNPLPIAFDGTISVGNVTITDDDGDELGINSDGSINVNIISAPSDDNIVTSTFGTASAVVSGATTSVVTYTVPLNKKGVLQRVVASGTNIGTYTLTINGTIQSILRTYFTGPYNVTFEFSAGQENGLVIQPGDIIEVTILHDRPFLGDFDGRIQVFELLQ